MHHLLHLVCATLPIWISFGTVSELGQQTGNADVKVAALAQHWTRILKPLAANLFRSAARKRCRRSQNGRTIQTIYNTSNSTSFKFVAGRCQAGREYCLLPYAPVNDWQSLAHTAITWHGGLAVKMNEPTGLNNPVLIVLLAVQLYLEPITWTKGLQCKNVGDGTGEGLVSLRTEELDVHVKKGRIKSKRGLIGFISLKNTMQEQKDSRMESMTLIKKIGFGSG